MVLVLSALLLAKMESVQYTAPPQIVETTSDPESVLCLHSSDVGAVGFKQHAAMAGHGVASSDQDQKEDNESFGYSDESSDSSSSISIDGIHAHQNISGHFSMRDSLLAEAWKRKKERALQDDYASLREHFIPHVLGRSSSDCGNVKLMTENHLLHRSASDVDKDDSPAAPRAPPAQSVTDDDLEELKGCIDLGFCFDKSSLPAFSHTLPALEVYCAVAQSLQESPYGPFLTASPIRVSSSTASASVWRVCRPGDAPEDVKGRLRHWAQAVACNAKLC